MRVGTPGYNAKFRNKGYRQGFTIVELLIVVVVIAILAAITIVAYNGIQNRAKDSAAQSLASQAAKKLAFSAVQNGDTFPVDKAGFLTTTGLVEGNGVIFQYTVAGDYKSYCQTTLSNGVLYYTTNLVIKPTAGLCPGHTPTGVASIVNLVVNPSLETDANGWTGSSGSLTPTRVSYSGKWQFRGVRTDTLAAAIRVSYSLPSTVTVGDTYTASMNVYSSVARTVTIGVRQAATTTTLFSTDYSFAAGETKRISTTGVTTVGSVYVNMLTATGVVGETYYVDEVMLTQGTTVYNYADGDSSGWAWDGTVGNSTSRGPAL